VVLIQHEFFSFSFIYSSVLQIITKSSPTNILGSSTTSAPANFDHVRKNANGGVLVTPSELQLAFSMLEPDKQGCISINNLKKKLGPLLPELTSKEYRFLMNDKKDFSLDDLKNILMENEISHFDPVAEAYKIFAHSAESSLNGDMLRQAFIAYGFGELSDEEFEILTRVSICYVSLLVSRFAYCFLHAYIFCVLYYLEGGGC
jgi:hypothetical protein